MVLLQYGIGEIIAACPLLYNMIVGEAKAVLGAGNGYGPSGVNPDMFSGSNISEP